MATQVSAEGPSGLPVDNPSKSYWHKEPSKVLLGHRTTKEVPPAADVVIVGSGITGAFAAHFLKEKAPDLNVVMLEAREACWGATGRNGGHCQPTMYTSAPHIAAFELRTYSYLKTLVEAYSIPCDWHSTTGVHAYYSPDLFITAKKVVEKLQDKYPDLAANVAVVTKGEGGSPSWLLEGERKELTLEGLRVDGAEGAIVQWNAASLWPYKLVAFVLERLLAAGGFNLQTNTPATGLKRVHAPAGFSSHHAHAEGASSSTWTVHTPRGDISAKHVLLATNGYTSHLLPQFADLIVPTRGQVSSLKPPAPPSPLPPVDIGHTFVFASDLGERRDDYLVQRPPPGAELVFGGGRFRAEGQGVGVWDDGGIDEPVAWYLRSELGGLMDLSARERDDVQGEHEVHAPRKELEPTFEWTGIMGYSRDSAPWVGPVPESAGGGAGLWVCAGYTGHGMPNATLSAKAVVDMMVPGRRDGDDLADEVDLPPEYLVTEDRLERARAGDTVAEADKKGVFSFEFGLLV